MHEIPDDVKRWTAKRRQALILQLVVGETTPAEAARQVRQFDQLQDALRRGARPLGQTRPILGRPPCCHEPLPGVPTGPAKHYPKMERRDTIAWR
jgi:hypothetical protein